MWKLEFANEHPIIRVENLKKKKIEENEIIFFYQTAYNI